MTDNAIDLENMPDIPEGRDLTQDEVWEVLKFAERAFDATGITANRSGMIGADIKILDTVFRNPDSSDSSMVAFSIALELQSQIYRKLISYLGNMLSFDFTYVGIAHNGKTDYKGNAYKKDMANVEDFFRRFDHKREFTYITRQLLRKEYVFCAPRFDGNRYFIQELPDDACKLIGKGEYGWRFAFDFSYFDGAEHKLELYPEFFSRTYYQLLAERLTPTGRISKRRGFDTWIKVPLEVGFVFKMNADTEYRIPIFSGLFKDLINQNLMRDLQKDSDMAAAQKVVIGQVGRLKDQQAKTGGNFDTDAKTLGMFMKLVARALGSAIKIAAIPLENIQAVEFDAEKGMYKDYLKTTISSSGVNANLLFSDSDNRSNSIETQLSLNVDEQMMAKSVYPQAEAFLDCFVNLFTESHTFMFKLEGTDFFTDRGQRVDRVTKMMTYGFMLPQKVATALSMSPFDFYRQIEEGNDSGIADKLTHLLNRVQTDSDGSGGRPRMNEGELSDAGQETRDSGGNLHRGGKL